MATSVPANMAPMLQYVAESESAEFRPRLKTLVRHNIRAFLLLLGLHTKPEKGEVNQTIS